MKILIFGAVWCPSCLVMKSIWNDIKKEKPNIEINHYDCDINTEAVKEWDINNILPVAIFVNNKNEEIIRINGEKSKQYLLDVINKIEEGVV